MVASGPYRLPEPLGLLAIPVIWTGLEYFRCELYYLRFAWLTPGLAFSNSPLLRSAGVYGITFVLLSLLAFCNCFRNGLSLGVVSLVGLAVAANIPAAVAPLALPKGPEVVGIQLEEASESEILRALDRGLGEHPRADVFVLSEDAAPAIPDSFFEWCRVHRRYLILGSSDPGRRRARLRGRMRFTTLRL